VGAIRHTSAGSLQAFHISDAAALGAHEWIERMLMNRPQALTPVLLLIIWGTSIVLSLALPFISNLSRKVR